MRWSGSARQRALLTLVAVGATVCGVASPAAATGASPAVSPTGTTAATPPTVSTPVTACATIGAGTTGPAVTTIQTLIATTADGDFGPQTAAALSKWQSAQGIPATGVVDAATWAVMPPAVAEAACSQRIGGAGFTVSCAVLSAGDTGPAVDVLETALELAVDGEFSDAVGQALGAAQQAASLPASATTNRRTWRALALTGTPVCTPGSTTPALPKDYAAQQKVRNQVAALAGALLEQPGTTTNKIALAAVAFAKQQIGKPYVYGGTGPTGYDCSGLQMTSYLHAGLTLPRVAASQYTGSGPTVPLNDAQAGDLLFFASDVTQPETIYHVAMYLGGGQVLDAPHTGATVSIRPLWTTDLLPTAVRPSAGLTLPLRRGATGWPVLQLQQMLNRLGAKLTVDGGFGAATRAAVKAWQQAHQLAPTGVVRLPTWLSLINPSPAGSTPPTTTPTTPTTSGAAPPAPGNGTPPGGSAAG
ncbi:MAG TPA: peptidoglycan-binding protein [Mycobacteriales bacterium]|nr:peptidoglycan-binding protein [Mycobacteriales bacterium]